MNTLNLYICVCVHMHVQHMYTHTHMRLSDKTAYLKLRETKAVWQPIPEESAIIPSSIPVGGAASCATPMTSQWWIFIRWITALCWIPSQTCTYRTCKQRENVNNAAVGCGQFVAFSHFLSGSVEVHTWACVIAVGVSGTEGPASPSACWDGARHLQFPSARSTGSNSRPIRNPSSPL